MNQKIQSKIIKHIESEELKKEILSYTYIDPLKFEIVLYIYNKIIHYPTEPIDSLKVTQMEPHKYFRTNNQLFYYLFSCNIKNKDNYMVVTMYTPENEFGNAYFYEQINFMISITTPQNTYSQTFDTNEIYDLLCIIFRIILQQKIYLRKSDVSITSYQRNEYASVLDKIIKEPSRKCKQIIESFLAIL